MSADSPVFETGKPALGLADLAVFCDELAALVRARVPLAVGFGSGAFASSHALQGIAARLAVHERLGRGLSEAMAAEGAAFPPVVRAVVTTGLLSGRLPEALESLSRAARTQLSVRRRMATALIYPAIVLITAGILVAFFSARLLHGIRGIYESGPFGVPLWLDRLTALAEHAHTLGFALPLLIVVLAALWLYRTWSVGSGGVAAAAPFGFLPGLRGVRRNLRLAIFSDMLGLLTSHGVGFPEAWRLAGEATGDRRLDADCQRIAEQLERGQSLSVALRGSRGLPRLFHEVVESAERQGALPAAFQELAGIHYRRAEHTAEWFKLVLPIVSSILLCGGIVLAYAASVWGPVVQMLYDVMRES